MKRRPFFWGLILATLATRLAIGRGLDLSEVSDMTAFTVDALVAAVALGAAVLFVVAWVFAFRRAPRRSTEPLPSPGPSLGPSLEAHLDEARRQLAARLEQLDFTRELLLKRTEDMDRLAAKGTAMASRLDEVQASVDHWRVKYEHAATELQAERARSAAEQTRLAGELMRGTLDASHRAHEMLESMRELVRRTDETNALRVEVAGLHAELERARSAAPAVPAPPERLYGGAVESLCFEVRRALNAVLGYSRLPMYDAERRPQPDDVRALEVAGERLLVFVNDLHDLSRVEAKALVLEPEAVDVESALRQAALDATERLQGKLSDFLVAAEPGLPLVRADRTRLTQILAALVQYGGPAKTVLSARAAGEFVALSVSHPDLTVADGARLFDPLAANGEDSATRVRLALARALATLSGGELTVTAGEAAGTVFTLTLPTATRGEGLIRPRARPLTDA